MTPTPPTTEPSTIAANETATWTREAGDYLSSDGYSLRYYFAGPSAFQVDAVASNSGWTITLDAAKTADKDPGTYTWKAYFEQGTGATLERHLFDVGILTLTPDITVAEPGDFTTHAARTLAIIEAAIEGRLTADIQKYIVDGTEVDKIPIERLTVLRGIYAQKVDQERNPRRAMTTRQVRFR